MMSCCIICNADSRMADGCRSAWQECALIVSLEMFNVLLERCNAMLKEQVECGQTGRRLLGEDLQIIFPAVKVSRHHPSSAKKGPASSFFF